MAHRLIDYSDTEIANALHFIDAHVEDLTPPELRAWRVLTEMLFNKMDVQRELDAEDAENAEPVDNRDPRDIYEPVTPSR